MSPDLFLPIALLSLGLVLLIAEVFIPSGGLIGILAVGLLIVSAWQAFRISEARGLQFLLALLVLIPLTLMLALYLWPRTPVARSAFLKAPTSDDVAPERLGAPLEPLVGQYGRALTPLRPSGMVDFDGRRLDGMSEQGLIAAGSLVRAVGIRGSRLVVREADDAPTASWDAS